MKASQQSHILRLPTALRLRIVELLLGLNPYICCCAHHGHNRSTKADITTNDNAAHTTEDLDFESCRSVAAIMSTCHQVRSEIRKLFYSTVSLHLCLIPTRKGTKPAGSILFANKKEVTFYDEYPALSKAAFSLLQLALRVLRVHIFIEVLGSKPCAVHSLLELQESIDNFDVLMQKLGTAPCLRDLDIHLFVHENESPGLNFWVARTTQQYLRAIEQIPSNIEVRVHLTDPSLGGNNATSSSDIRQYVQKLKDRYHRDKLAPPTTLLSRYIKFQKWLRAAMPMAHEQLEYPILREEMASKILPVLEKAWEAHFDGNKVRFRKAQKEMLIVWECCALDLRKRLLGLIDMADG